MSDWYELKVFFKYLNGIATKYRTKRAINKQFGMRGEMCAFFYADQTTSSIRALLCIYEIYFNTNHRKWYG